MDRQRQFTSKENIENLQVRKRLLFPLLFCFLVYELLFVFVFKEITANTILIALLMIFAISIVFGKMFGIFSGFALALMQISSQYIIYWVNNPILVENFISNTNI